MKIDVNGRTYNLDLNKVRKAGLLSSATRNVRIRDIPQYSIGKFKGPDGVIQFILINNDCYDREQAIIINPNDRLGEKTCIAWPDIDNGSNVLSYLQDGKWIDTVDIPSDSI